MDLSEKASDFDGKRHFWELARAGFLRRLLHRSGWRPRRWLDIGCGDGYLLESLGRDYSGCRLIALDPAAPPELTADFAARGMTLTRDLAEAVPATCDLLTLFDVLEHIEDDVDYLKKLVAVVPAGTVVALTVPAFPILFSDHDRRLRHFRRYTHRTLLACLLRSGLEVRESGYFFASLLAARLGLCCLRRANGGGIGGGAVRPLWLNGWLTQCLTWDAACCRALARCGLRLPGLSVYALCQKTSS